MSQKPENTDQVTAEIEQKASKRATDRARATRWDLNIAIFLFTILVLVLLLSNYTKLGIEVVGPVALFGFVMVWIVAWRREKYYFKRFYGEEVSNLAQESKQTLEDSVKETVKKTVEETIEEQVQKAFRERWK